jgi:hypothetical protein
MDRTRAEDKRNGGRGAGRIRDRERTFGPASEIAARNFRSVRDLSALARKRAHGRAHSYILAPSYTRARTLAEPARYRKRRDCTVVEITARRRSKRDLLSIE